ncbi:hypothetical protein A2U01_0056282, partial [Trifolium medium]|nr:hypothetical protein [Trifolium medium]
WWCCGNIELGGSSKNPTLVNDESVSSRAEFDDGRLLGCTRGVGQAPWKRRF